MSHDEPEEEYPLLEKNRLLDLSKSADLMQVESDLPTLENWQENKAEIEKWGSAAAYILGQQRMNNVLNWILGQGFTPEEVVERLHQFTNGRDKFLVHVYENFNLR